MTRFSERLFVWTGGALFLSALAVTAWLYGSVMGGPLPYGGWLPVGVDALLITVFATHHSVFARSSVKRAVARAVPDPLLRSAYVWVASLLLLAVCWWWQPVGGVAYRVDGAAAWVLGGLQVVGLWISAQSARAIAPLELAGIRPPRPREPLQVRGPYGLVRHPLYLGWVLIVFGAAHMTGDRLTFAALTTLYLIIAIPWEERSLEREFGAHYQRYQADVPWRIVPYLY